VVRIATVLGLTLEALGKLVDVRWHGGCTYGLCGWSLASVASSRRTSRTRWTGAIPRCPAAGRTGGGSILVMTRRPARVWSLGTEPPPSREWIADHLNRL